MIKIKTGCSSDELIKLSVDIINDAGNAVQKFSELQKVIEKELAPILVVQKYKFKIWSDTDWKQKWNPSREKIIKYRNSKAHLSNPYIICPRPNALDNTPVMLLPEKIERGKLWTWRELENLYETNPEYFASPVDICENLCSNTIAWLNSAYGQLIHALEQFLNNETYQDLWGWDTFKHGQHILKEGKPVGLFHTLNNPNN